MLSYKLLNVFITIGTVLSIYFVSKSISKDKKISILITINKNIKEEPTFTPSRYPFFNAFFPKLKPTIAKIIIIPTSQIILLPLE